MFMVLQVNHGRGSLLADPAKPVRPWFADKSFCAAGLADYLPEGPNAYYEERVLHFAMLSDSTVYLFAGWAGYVYGTRATIPDFNLLSSRENKGLTLVCLYPPDCSSPDAFCCRSVAVLRELDATIGCDIRTWIPDASFRYTDNFFMSGVMVGMPSRNVWRLTPRLPLPDGSMDPNDLVQPPSSSSNGSLVLSPVMFDFGALNGGPSRLAPSALHFPGGAVAIVDTSSWPALFPSPSSTTGNATRPTPAAWGLWIVQSAGSGGVRVMALKGGLETGWPVRNPN